MIPAAKVNSGRGKPIFLMGLIGIVLLLNLMVCFWVFQYLQKSRAQHQQSAATLSENMAHLLQNSIGNTLNIADLGLEVIGDEVSRQMASGGIDAGSMNAYLAHLRSHMPELNSFRIANADGIISYGHDFPQGHGLSVADQWHFQYLRDHPGAGVVVSDPHLGLVSGKWVITIAKRLQRPDGSFFGVAMGTIHLNRFSDLFASLDIGSKGTINLRDANLHIILPFFFPTSLRSHPPVPSMFSR